MFRFKKTKFWMTYVIHFDKHVETWTRQTRSVKQKQLLIIWTKSLSPHFKRNKNYKILNLIKLLELRKQNTQTEWGPIFKSVALLMFFIDFAWIFDLSHLILMATRTMHWKQCAEAGNCLPNNAFQFIWSFIKTTVVWNLREHLLLAIKMVGVSEHMPMIWLMRMCVHSTASGKQHRVGDPDHVAHTFQSTINLSLQRPE